MFKWLRNLIYNHIKEIVPIYTNTIKRDIDDHARRFVALEDRFAVFETQYKLIKAELHKNEESVQIIQKYKNELLKESQALRDSMEKFEKNKKK